MFTHVAAIVGLAVLCGLWIIVQRWVANNDPEQPGVEGHRHCRASAPDCSSTGCSSCSVDLRE